MGSKRAFTTFCEEATAIQKHSLPLLMFQVASIGTTVVDTAILGHYDATELAAIAIAGGVYVSIAFALIGVLQSIGPVVAQHYGAKDDEGAVLALWNGLWLALALSVIGWLLLSFPSPLLSLTRLDSELERRVRAVLQVFAYAMPVILFYRTFAAYFNALGKARVLMAIGLITLPLHAALAWALANGLVFWPPLGAVGCAISTAMMNLFALIIALTYAHRSESIRGYRMLARFTLPRLGILRELLRVGGPMGLSNFVEISSTALVSLIAAPLGPVVIAGHRIIANLAGVLYMVPLSIGVATLSRAGQAVGAGEVARCRSAVRAGFVIATASALLAAALLALAGRSVITVYSADQNVLAVAMTLLPYLALHQIADAVQTIFTFSLRALKITFVPMLVHVLSFWGVGLAGGVWIAFGLHQGIQGFWIATVLSSSVASVLFGLLVRASMKQKSFGRFAEVPS